MASCSTSENKETKPQAIQSSSAQEQIQTQKHKEESQLGPMADSSIFGDSSSKARNHREGDRERHPSRDHHRPSGGQSKRQYQQRYMYRDQGAYHRHQDRKGRQKFGQQEEHHQQKGLSREMKDSSKSKTVTDSGTPGGIDGDQAASSEVVNSQDRDAMDSQDWAAEPGEGTQSKKDRNRRRRQRKQGGRKEGEPASVTQNVSDPSSKDKRHVHVHVHVDGSSLKTGKDLNPGASDEGDPSMSHSSKGSGGTSSPAGGRRPMRSHRDQHQWRSEQRAPRKEEGRRYYHNNRDYWRGEKRTWRGDERRHSPSHDQQRSHSKNDSNKRDVSEEQGGATSSNSADDQNTIGDTQADSSSKSTDNSTKPESEKKTTEKADRRPQSSKTKSYDYTKPRHSGNDLPSSSKYKGRSQHRLKVDNKEFTPTIQSDELSQQLTAETYECMVCCDRVRERDQIWSCQNCYHIFHLKCIKKWATAPTFASTQEGGCLHTRTCSMQVA